MNYHFWYTTDTDVRNKRKIFTHLIMTVMSLEGAVGLQCIWEILTNFLHPLPMVTSLDRVWKQSSRFTSLLLNYYLMIKLFFSPSTKCSCKILSFLVFFVTLFTYFRTQFIKFQTHFLHSIWLFLFFIYFALSAAS